MRLWSSIALALLACGATAAVPSAGGPHPWPDAGGRPLEERLAPPEGCGRVPAAPGSFAAWLRRLPLRPGRPPVHLFDGRLKGNQEAHEAVVAIDVGRRDLQQCADAVIRLRAEWLWSQGREDAIAFRFTSGDLARWTAWRAGERPRVEGSRVRWVPGAATDGSYQSFCRYLDLVFTYAGSASLARELVPVSEPARVEGGDVFIQGGHPGHAVLVVDVAERGDGRRVFLLAQSYMPAQEIHVLRNPAAGGSPWYAAAGTGELVTPEWVFRTSDLRRFEAPACDGPP
ncbi:MAG: DUF4846 domain-containing protein [Thermoanaerobaculaceae bacterium]|nr:DUF4846 domain-containing protein [Thermoanaerobaculaceae bacterium]